MPTPTYKSFITKRAVFFLRNKTNVLGVLSRFCRCADFITAGKGKVVVLTISPFFSSPTPHEEKIAGLKEKGKRIRFFENLSSFFLFFSF